MMKHYWKRFIGEIHTSKFQTHMKSNEYVFLKVSYINKELYRTDGRGNSKLSESQKKTNLTKQPYVYYLFFIVKSNLFKNSTITFFF